MADQSWAAQPPVMTRRTIDQAARRISEHTHTHGLVRTRVVLHGGEPLLAGVEMIDFAARSIRRHVPGRTDIILQTNGVNLDHRFLKVMHTHGIRAGISLDGTAAAHDRHRRYRDGRGSHAETARALRLLGAPAHRELFAGLLCTVDLRNDPLQVYQALLEFEPPAVDFLLPHGNWSSPPPARAGIDGAPYADWLGVIFDHWISAPRRETGVRLFEEIIHLLLGGQSSSEQVGLSPVGFLVVETNGAVQQTDTLKAAHAGAPDLGLNIFDHPIDAALRHPAVAARQLGLLALADDCRRCHVVSTCGGGHYPHRYRRGTGFRNPSVYCADLVQLIGHIRRALSTRLPVASR